MRRNDAETPMLVTNHVLSGALIGWAVRRPVPAFLLGVASHFAVDAVPHWGNWCDQRTFLPVAVADGLTGLAVMAGGTAAATPARRGAVIAGMIGAALPDLDKPSMLWFGRSPWPKPVQWFHSHIQDEAPHRFGIEIAAAGVFAACCLLARRSAERPAAARP